MDEPAIATRELTLLVGEGKSVMLRVEVGTPRRVENGTWECRFDVVGPDGSLALASANRNEADDRGAFTACGVDGVQALENVFAGLRAILDRFEDRISWLGTPGWHGIHKRIVGFTLTMERRLIKLVDDEEAAICAGLADPSTRVQTRRSIADPPLAPSSPEESSL